jgi:acyl-coenzyme A synthetase/AMP-(fatty) acid ligase
MSGECVGAILVTCKPLAVDVIADFLGQRLASWEMPVAYIGLDRLPRGPEGKVLTQPLRELFVQRMQEHETGNTAPDAPQQNTHLHKATGPIDRLIQWAQTRSAKPALQGMQAPVTYAELLQGVCARAAWLHAAGIRASDTVSLSFNEPADSLQQQVETFYALAWLGAAVLPLYPEMKEERRAALVDQLGAQWLISRLLPDTSRAQRLDPSSYVAAHWAAQQVTRGDDPSLPFHYEFTSGTTGAPKAMAATHAEYGAMCSRAISAYGWRQDDVAMAPIRWPTKVGIRVLLRTLYVGASFLDLPFPDTRHALAGLVAKRGLSNLGCSAWQLRRLLSSEPLPSSVQVPLRLLSAVGSPVAPHEILAARQSLVANFQVGYGTTEIGLMGYLGAEDPPNAPFRMLPGMQVQVCNDQGQVLPHGQIGRLRFCASWLPVRYAVGNVHPVEGFHDGWFVSSDLGLLETDGRLRVMGRADHAINVGGIKVMPQDVEKVLLSHPDVADAAVVGMPDAMSGECVAAFLVLRRPLVVDTMLDYLRPRLEPLEIPVAYLGLDKIPRNPEGKVLVQPLRELLAAKMRAS